MLSTLDLKGSYTEIAQWKVPAYNHETLRRNPLETCKNKKGNSQINRVLMGTMRWVKHEITLCTCSSFRGSVTIRMCGFVGVSMAMLEGSVSLWGWRGNRPVSQSTSIVCKI